MAALGGSIKAVSINNRSYKVAADADGARDLGGYTTTRNMNGDGSSRKSQERKPWKLGGLTIAVDDALGDQEFLQDTTDAPDDVAISIELITGEVYQGEGSLEDDLDYSTMNATCGISLSGSFKLTRQ